VTVLASQPSVSIETETTQRIDRQAARICHGIHHLAQKRNVVNFFALLKFVGELAAALHDFAPEAFNFVARHAAEIIVKRVTGFELFAVNQQRVWARERAIVFVEISEQGEPTVSRVVVPSAFSR